MENEKQPQKIKLEITFSDSSVMEKEILLTSDTAVSPPADSQKMPWITVGILAFIVCASLATGVYHWYTEYFQSTEAVYHAAETEDEQLEEIEPIDEIETDEQDVPPEIPRPEMDVFPEFIALWEEYGNEDIAAVLTLGGEEFMVTQSDDNVFYITHDINRNRSPHGWVFLDSEVDLLTGSEHNMVVYDPVGGFIRRIREYVDYDYFLANPAISFSTLYGNFEWEIFAFYVAPRDFPFAVVNHESDEAWGAVLEQFTMASMYNTMLDVTMYDQILTVAVPTDISPDLFYVLQARMLRHITS
jgi:hypothetical protein